MSTKIIPNHSFDELLKQTATAIMRADNWADRSIKIARRSRNEDWRQAENHARAVLDCLEKQGISLATTYES